jgi:dTDP-4-dehydrorhamnose reductase
MTMLVFGKTGQVATCLQAQSDEVRALWRDQADLTQPDAMRAIIAATDADVIINAAAYTAVDKAETDADTAEIVNHTTVAAMAQAAAARDIPFLHISTDYVFPGGGTEPWNTDAETGPLGVYGATKLRGEDAVRAAGGRFAILRTSWVFSAHGNNFVKTMMRLGAERDSLTVVGDQIGGPTAAADIAATLLVMAAHLRDDTAPSGTYHYSGQPDVSWAAFAGEIFAQGGVTCDVTPIPTTDYPTPAKRPLNSRLNCVTLQRDYGIRRPDWRMSLSQVLMTLGENQ